MVAFRTIAVHLDFENILKFSNQVFLANKSEYFLCDDRQISGGKQMKLKLMMV